MITLRFFLKGGGHFDVGNIEKYELTENVNKGGFSGYSLVPPKGELLSPRPKYINLDEVAAVLEIRD